MSDDLARRRGLTFAQAEGADPLPTQLQPREISPEFRSVIWAAFYTNLNSVTGHSDTWVKDHYWYRALRLAHIQHFHAMIDDFPIYPGAYVKFIKPIFQHGDYVALLGFIQYIVRNIPQTSNFGKIVETYLVSTRSAYRLIEHTFVPAASPEEGAAISTAIIQAGRAGLAGSRAHLLSAGELLSQGKWADSVRESVHAVESTARAIEPSAELSKALARLEQSAQIHGALRKGFGAIYGYTSDEKGIRHPMIEEGTAAVDETDALFMLGACASFVTYLIGKATAAKLLT